jgi:hypothetical protein
MNTIANSKEGLEREHEHEPKNLSQTQTLIKFIASDTQNYGF